MAVVANTMQASSARLPAMQRRNEGGVSAKHRDKNVERRFIGSVSVNVVFGPVGQSRESGTAPGVRQPPGKPGNSLALGPGYEAAGTMAENWCGTSSQPPLFWLTCTNTFEPTAGEP